MSRVGVTRLDPWVIFLFASPLLWLFSPGIILLVHVLVLFLAMHRFGPLDGSKNLGGLPQHEFPLMNTCKLGHDNLWAASMFNRCVSPMSIFGNIIACKNELSPYLAVQHCTALKMPTMTLGDFLAACLYRS